jgi:nucleoside-diphosphate-sugar epimerase
MNKSVSILGCGWLGLPLAQHLVNKKYKVNGSTTSQNKMQLLQNAGINPFQIDLSSFLRIDLEFFKCSVLIINIPPALRKRDVGNHLDELQHIFDTMLQEKPENILFVSSTSVYKDENRIMAEEDADSESDIFLIEQKVIDNCTERAIPFTILRCGGLMGYDRIPCKYYSGKTNLTLPDTPVNYIHRDDVIAIIADCLENEHWGEIYNAVAPHHPGRKEVIAECCNRSAFILPEYSSEVTNEAYKIISSDKLMYDLSYRFIYPDPLQFPY